MVERYDIIKDEMIKVTQEYFDGLEKRIKDVMSHYKENAPDKFEEFKQKYLMTGNTNV